MMLRIFFKIKPMKFVRMFLSSILEKVKKYFSNIFLGTSYFFVRRKLQALVLSDCMAVLAEDSNEKKKYEKHQ